MDSLKKQNTKHNVLQAQAQYAKVLKNHKKNNFCHSIDKSVYKILCIDFFSDKKNYQTSTNIANECFDCLQCTKSFVDWLKMEWYG